MFMTKRVRFNLDPNFITYADGLKGGSWMSRMHHFADKYHCTPEYEHGDDRYVMLCTAESYTVILLQCPDSIDRTHKVYMFDVS